MTDDAAIRVIIVDDEQLARQVLREHLLARGDVEILAECANGFEAVKAVSERQPDLLLLDVQMPKLDGFEVLELIGRSIPVVFVTAYDEFAVRAFEVHAVDYLLKPFSDERFQASLDRAIWHLRAGQAHAMMAQMHALLGTVALPGARAGTRATLDRILLKGPDRIRLLPVQQIAWIEAAGMYVRLHTRDGAVHLHRGLLGHLDAALDKRRFVRVHRSAIVNIEVIDELQQDAHGDYTVVLKDRTAVRLGRRYRDRLQDRLGQDL
jgi:two-component system LytT family response regulator